MYGNGANYNNNNSSGDIMSWVAVIICLVVFWPVGLFLLLKKISSSTKNHYSSSVNPGGRYQQRPPMYRRPAQSAYAQPNPKQYYRPGRQPHQPYQQGGAPGSAQSQPYQQGGAPAAEPQSQPYQAYTAGQPYYQAYPGQGKAGQYKAPGAAGAGQADKTAHAKNQADKKQTSAKSLAVALTVLAVVLGIMGVIFLSSGLSAIAVAGLSAGSLGATIFGAFSLLGTVMTAVMRGTVLRRVSKYAKYAAVIGNRDIIPISEIAKTVGEPSKKTQKALQDMIDSGYFGDQAYIDSGLDSFVLSREAAEKARRAADTTEKKGEAADGAPNGDTAEGNQYVAIINELHMLCSQTSDPSICGKIERIEELTAKIFRIVEENPEKLPQIRRFMNYYLPTTLKLLHSYQTLERQGIDGENITSAKQDIERILDTLADGYEQQLDNLFKSDKLDISADINVLENLMEQDGLTNEGDIMKTAGGN